MPSLRLEMSPWWKKIPRMDTNAARLNQIREDVRDLFTTEEAVDRWLRTPAAFLDGKRPLDLLDSTEGTERVIGVSKGLAYGNFF